MSDDVECPYCEETQEIDHDDGYGYDENETHQQICFKCGKTFIFTTSVTYFYHVAKADCLNEGGEHVFEKVSRYPPVIRGEVLVRCAQCQEEKDVDYKDAHLYGYNQEEINKAHEKFEETYK